MVRGLRYNGWLIHARRLQNGHRKITESYAVSNKENKEVLRSFKAALLKYVETITSEREVEDS